MPAAPGGGPLAGIRVVELASEHAAFAGKLLAGLGADVVVVEPPGGHASRAFGPFADDRPGPERSLWWWHYNAGKRGVVLDLEAEGELLRRLVAGADVVLEGEPPGRLAALGLDHDVLRAGEEGLIWVSVTPFGRDGPRSGEVATDLTVLAGGGPVWSCGYDDHSLPPVRGGGNQGYHTASLWAVMATLTAVVNRDLGGSGQHLDVSMHAAANVTTEAATYEWLVAGRTVQRQTGRHAAVTPSMNVNVVAADGRGITSGVPPRTAEQFRRVLGWLDELGLRDQVDDEVFLEMGTQIEGVLPLWEVGVDPELTAIFAAGRQALTVIATHLPAEEFFVQAQRLGLACGAILAPEEVIGNEHFVARGFPVPLPQSEVGRDVVHPGAPFRMSATPWRLSRPAPRLGEHDAEVLGPLWAPARRPG
ncbi:MAG TPA: CoA transferase [Acidimicrobiales bacterium]|nr:CoA transferase [Acidimicrobiales bacterium]